MFFETWNAKAGDESVPDPGPLVLLLHTMADQEQECARGGGVSHILAENKLLASLYSKNA